MLRTRFDVLIIKVICSYLQVFAKDADKDTVILLGARASRVENQDAIDACIVGMLGDPKEVCYFFPLIYWLASYKQGKKIVI